VSSLKKGIKGVAAILEGLGLLAEGLEEGQARRRHRAAQLAQLRARQAQVRGTKRQKLVAKARAGKAMRKLPVPEGMVLKVANVRSLDQRVKYIRQMIQKGRNDPRIRALSVKIVSKKCGKKHCIDEKDYVSEVKAIFDWVRKNVRYVRDSYDRDTFQHPVRTIQFGGGDCDDYSIVLASMLQAIGYPVRLRVIKTHAAQDWNHIYIQVGIPPGDPQKWMDLDGSENRPAGWAPPDSMIHKVRDFEID
jgi:hypothetical protein